MLILVSDELFIRNFSAISAISAGQKNKDLSERLKAGVQDAFMAVFVVG